MKYRFTFIFSIFSILAGSAQTFVNTSPENKKVVLEEFTGIHCGYCPAGHVIAQDISSSYPDDVVLVNIHVGGFAEPGNGEPDFRTNWGVQIKNISGLTGYPSGQVNRQLFNSPIVHSTVGKPAMSRSHWEDASNIVLTEPSYVNVAAQSSINMNTRELTVNVEAFYTANGNGTNKLNVLLLQNNVEGPQSGGSNYNPSAILANGNYSHQHMFRHSLTNYWGVTIPNNSAGSFFSDTYSYTIPADLNGVAYDLNNLEVVVFIAEQQYNVISGNISSLSLLTDIPEDNNEAVSFYPNPAKLTSTLEISLNQPSKVAYEIYNIIGKKVMNSANQQYLPAGIQHLTINTAELVNGTYFLNYSINNEIKTYKFIVSN
jgi:thiol-disulfide isomerase/thioredoxin